MISAGGAAEHPEKEYLDPFCDIIMPLESVASILDDGTHVQLDKVVLNTCDAVIEPSALGALAFLLLATIVSNSEGTLDSQYGNTTNAKALLARRRRIYWRSWKTHGLRRSSTGSVT
jgi:hypothetical protein